MTRPGRIALLVAATAYALALLWAALVLPGEVPSHFDAAGRVDDWSSRASVLRLWVAIGAVVIVGLPLVARAATSGDGRWVNLPQAAKEHWWAPERRAEFRARFQDDLEGFAALTAALLLALLAVTTWVAVDGRDGAPAAVLPSLVGLYLVATGVWVVRLLRSYRPPAS